jgi:ankyrin repeat protein
MKLLRLPIKERSEKSLGFQVLFLLILFASTLLDCGYHKSENTGTRVGGGGTVIEKTEVQELEDLVGAGTEEALEALRDRVRADNVNTQYDYPDKYGNGVTLLMIAADWLQPASIRVLVEIGADNSIVDSFGRDAFFYAERSANKRLQASNASRWNQCVELLPRSRIEEIESSLRLAIGEELASDFVEELLESLKVGDHALLDEQLNALVELVPNVEPIGASSELENQGLGTISAEGLESMRSRFAELANGCRAPLQLTDLTEYAESFKAIEGPAPVEELNALLIAAVLAGDVAAIQPLVDDGANLNHLTSEGVTPLMVALIEQQWAVVQNLIQIASSGGELDLNVRSTEGETALGLTNRLMASADARAQRRYQRFAQFIERFGGTE